MSRLVITETGKVRKADDVELAEEIDKERKKKGPWGVIEKLVEVWTSRAPEEVEVIKVNISDQKEMLIDKEFGQTKGGGGQERRFKLIFPRTLQLLIRTQYKADELPFDKEFFTKFARKYPAFRVAEKD